MRGQRGQGWVFFLAIIGAAFLILLFVGALAHR